MAERKVSFIISANIERFQKGLNAASRSMDGFGKKMERTGRAMSTAITLPVLAIGTAAAKSAMDFESAFAGVRKTVDATESQFAGLRKGILNMSKELPTTANEIAGVAESAGQLGIQTENILSFSKTMVMLGDTTNMVASEAATSFARIANVMQLPQDQFDRMGSAVVDLGNNFATTEAEIVEFANRIAGAGKIAGLSADQVFAIGTALSSVGIRAESGGTAVQKALLNMNDAVARGNSNLQVFAKTAGMSAAEFQKAWRDDSGAAFTAFVNGLGRSGDNATQILSDVGLNSERVRATFLSLSGAGDLLNRTMNTGSTAWEENSALVNEAQQRYDTFASKLAVFRNRLTSIGITFGDMILPGLTRLMEKTEGVISSFAEMEEGTRVEILKMAGLLAVSGPLLIAVGKAAQIFAGFARFIQSRFVLIAAAFALGVGAGQWMVDNWGTLIEKVKGIWTSLGELISDQVASWEEAWGKGFKGMAQKLIAFELTWEGFIGRLSGVPPEAEEGTEELGNKIEGAGGKADESGLKFTSFYDSLKKGMQTIYDSVAALTGADDALSNFMSLFDENPSTDATVNTEENRTENTISKRSLPQLPKLGHFDKIVSRAQSATEGVRSLGEVMSESFEGGKKSAEIMGQALQSSVSSSITSFAETLGNAFTGDAGASGFFNNILLIVADFGKQLGRSLVAAGIAAKSFKNLLANPTAAIIAGGALIAASTIVANQLRKGPEAQKMASGGIVPSGFPNDTYPALLSSGERVVPAPLPLNSGGTQNVNLSGEFRIKGTDLVLSLERANQVRSR